MNTTQKDKAEILIADDHPIVCEGIEKILSKTADLVLSGKAHTGEELMDKINQRAWDLLLLDIAIPGASGMQLLKEVKQKQSELPVVMLSIYPEERFAIDFLKAGASGYVHKSNSPEQMLESFRRVRKGETYISPFLAQKVALDTVQLKTQPHKSLSTREYQVMCMIASGKTVSEIGKELNLSVKTISTHRSRILKKMKMKSNARLTNYCIKNFIIDFS